MNRPVAIVTAPPRFAWRIVTAPRRRWKARATQATAKPQTATLNDLPPSLARARRAALAVIAVIVAASTLTAFAESYRGLFDWALRHDLPRSWCFAWPLMVDAFVAVGELALFVALLDGWTKAARRWPWTVTLAGLAVSVAGNVGHIAATTWTARATAAVPPLAAAAGLTVGLGVLKRVVGRYPATVTASPGRKGHVDGHQAASTATDAATGPATVATPDGLKTGPVAAALAGLPSNAARIRYMAGHCGSREVPTVRAELARYGYGLPAEAVRSAIRRDPPAPPLPLTLVTPGLTKSQ